MCKQCCWCHIRSMTIHEIIQKCLKESIFYDLSDTDWSVRDMNVFSLFVGLMERFKMLKYVDNFYLPFEKLTQYNKRTHILNTHSGSWSPPGFLSDGKEAVHFDLLGVKSACEQEEKGFNWVSCSVGQVSSPHKMSLHLFKFLVTKCGTLWSFEATETTQNVKHRAPNFVSLLSKFYIHCFLEQ